jgi:hypothetical protein
MVPTGQPGTADCGQICRGVDGCDYAIKDGKTGGSTAITPHCEWFCTELGERVGIAGPQCKVIRHPDGTLVFGSRWEGGVVKASTTAGNWWDQVKAGVINLDDLKGPLSRIYAFDHFVHNVDRHGNNFLIRDQHGGHTVLAMDYSRAWITHGFPLPALPMNSSTVHTQRALTTSWGAYIDLSEVESLINALDQIQQAQI